jgi:peptidoglycan/xylan/chitin deacetylase (PgdA/CDA1 family)
MTKRLLALAISAALRGFDVVSGWIRQGLGRQISHKGIILYYHAVKAHERGSFARQMDEVLNTAHPFPAGYPEAMKSGRRNVAITFDDGFRSVVENAVPELSDRSIPFTVFVPSGDLGGRPSWIHDPSHPCWNEQILSAAELRGLACHPLATVGSHSVTHCNLVKLESHAATEELIRSKAELESAAGIEVDLFSFPHGAHSAALVDQASEAGYRRVFTVEPTTIRPDRGAFIIGRVAANPDDWAFEFCLKIAGAYRWRHYFHRLRDRYRAR